MPSGGISIVVPVLNEAATIRHTLSLLAPWRARGCEVLVVDGGSEDGTPELARELADAVFSSPAGRALQMNTGAAAARGRLLVFLHADTHLPSAALPLLEAIACDPEPAWGRFDVRLDAPQRLLRVVEWLMNLRSRLTGMATGDQAMFVTRELWTQVGGFPSLPLMEDLALSSALKRHVPPRCLRVRVTTSARRWLEGGVCRTIVLMWALRLGWWLGVAPARLAAWYRQVR